MATFRDDDVADTEATERDMTNASALRDAMISELCEIKALRSHQVVDAFRAVPREAFAPGAPLEDVYTATTSVVTKCDESGVPTSSVSAPELQAFMLEQAELSAGMNVLEVGSGGYNAALLAQLVGPTGSVTSIDIDPEVTERARRYLETAGYPSVDVVLGDAEHGFAEAAPYDRIIVTVGAWDIPPAWAEQLTADGLLVVPLRMRGLTRSLALERSGDHLASRSAMLCGFVAIQGAGAHPGQRLWLRGDEIYLRFDDNNGPDDPQRLAGLLDTRRTEVWSDVTIGRQESFDTLQLWLATTMPGFCLLTAPPGPDSGLVDDGHRWFNLAAVGNDSFAYLTSRPAVDGAVEFGVHGYGPDAAALAHELTIQLRRWNDDQRRNSGPRFQVWPRATSAAALPEGLSIDKQHSRVTITWPQRKSVVDTDRRAAGVPGRATTAILD